MARPALFHRADRLGTSDAAAKPKGPRVHAATVEPCLALRARKSPALAGTLCCVIGGRAFARHRLGTENAHPGGRFVFQRNRSTNRFVAFARGTSAGRT